VSVSILHGDCREVLKTLPAQSVHCCVTSPPYFGLRDYGHGDQIGLESTPAEYVEQMVAVFREVRRVLRDDGTLWLNLGDTYASTSKGSGGAGSSTLVGTPAEGNGQRFASRKFDMGDAKPKDLLGIPWRVAFALQADGWYLRQDIIWHKPNPMPESVRDRCTKAHEYVFLLSKSERYYWNAEAMQEQARAADIGSMDGGAQRMPDGTNANNGRNFRPGRSGNHERKPASARGVPVDTGGNSSGGVAGSVPWEGFTRNKRSVWTIATKPYREAHFATMAPELAETCIKAGCPEGGTVLDPFGGAGTTGLVADQLQRSAILCELNADYIEIARRRIASDAPLFADVREAAQDVTL